MMKVCLTFVFSVLLTFCGSVRAEQAPEEILKAIVRVHANVPENARTAVSLGTDREGSGVVIDKRGYVLTIGYLILEAERIEVVGQSGETVKAVFVAYDHNSGFGILRAEKPLSILQGTDIRDVVVHSADRHQYFHVGSGH